MTFAIPEKRLVEDVFSHYTRVMKYTYQFPNGKECDAMIFVYYIVNYQYYTYMHTRQRFF